MVSPTASVSRLIHFTAVGFVLLPDQFTSITSGPTTLAVDANWVVCRIHLHVTLRDIIFANQAGVLPSSLHCSEPLKLSSFLFESFLAVGLKYWISHLHIFFEGRLESRLGAWAWLLLNFFSVLGGCLLHSVVDDRAFLGLLDSGFLFDSHCDR